MRGTAVRGAWEDSQRKPVMVGPREPPGSKVQGWKAYRCFHKEAAKCRDQVQYPKNSVGNSVSPSPIVLMYYVGPMDL